MPLSRWLLAVFMMVSNKNGVVAFELHRTLGVTNETAWFMLHRIRAAMERRQLAETMRGTVEADETWIGGDAKNRHASSSKEPVPVKRLFASLDGTHHHVSKAHLHRYLAESTSGTRRGRSATRRGCRGCWCRAEDGD